MRKRVVLSVIMALLLALSVCGAGLVFADTTATASTALATENILSVTGATVTTEADKVYGTNTKHHTGLYVEKATDSDTFSGGIKGIFGQNKTETELKYTFWCDVNSKNKGNVVFRITDATDSANYIEIEHFGGTEWYGHICVIDKRNGGSIVRSTRYWANASNPATIYTAKNWNSETMHGPDFNSSDNNSQGTIKLVWESDVLVVYGASQAGAVRVLAKFDGTNAADTTKQEFGLDKIDFPNGYKISFESKKSSDQTVPILFESIKSGDDTISLATATLESEPSWYTAYQSVTEISVDDYQVGSYAVGDKVPTATFVRPAIENFTATAVEKTYIKSEGGEYTELSADATFTESGKLTVKYVAENGSNFIGNEFEKEFTVLGAGEYYKSSDLITTDGAVTEFADSSGTVTHTGVLIEPKVVDEAKVAFSGNINGIFSGDSKFKFSFPGTFPSGQSGKQGSVTFTIADAVDSSKNFEVRFRKSGYYAIMSVAHNGAVRTTRQWNGVIGTSDKYGDGYLTFFGTDNYVSTQFELVWEDEVLVVKGYGNYNPTGRIIAKFDDTSAVQYKTSPADSDYGLPKIAFPNGYKVSFKSEKDGDISPLMFEEIYGVDTSKMYVEADDYPEFYKEYQNIIEISVDDYQYGSYAVGDKIPTATYLRPALGVTENAVEKILVSKDGGAFGEVAADAEFTEGGEYTVKYVAVEGASYVGNEFEKSFTVLASGEYYEASDLVTTDGVKTGGVQKAYGTNAPHSGVFVDKGEEDTITGNINGVFGQDKTETELKYTFFGNSRVNGSVVFRITDVTDSSNYIEIEHYRTGGDSYPGVALIDKRNGKNEIRATKCWAAGTDWVSNAKESADVYMGHWFGEYNNIDLQGVIKLTWEGDVLVVTVAGQQKGTKILAKFDGTSAITQGTSVATSEFGLDKISFPKGYTISFVSSKNNGSTVPILFESIKSGGETVELSKRYVASEEYPEFYETYQELISISLDSEPATTGVTVKPYVIPAATYKFPAKSDVAAAAVAKIELKKDGGEFVEVQAGERTITEKGSYTLRYTAVADGDNIGNVIERSFTIYDEYFDFKNVVADVVGATVTTGADVSGTISHKGILIEPEEVNGEYSGKLNGVFNGDGKFTFNFPGTLISDGGNHNNRSIDFTFRFTDASNPDNYFEIFFFNDGWNGWYTSAAVRDVNGNVRAALPSGKIFSTTASDIKDDYLRVLPNYGGNNSRAGYIDLRWDGDVLGVYMLNPASGNEYVLAKFDGTSAISNEADSKAYGLDKIAFADGYVVSFAAKAKGTTATAPLLIEAINDIAVADFYKAVTSDDFTEIELLGDATVSTNATRDEKTAAELNLGAKFFYGVTFGDFKVNAFETVYATPIDLTVVGDKDYTYTFIGHSINQTLTVIDGAPVVSLKGGLDAVYRVGGPNASDMAISANDVIAIDELDGELEANAIAFTVKLPGSDEFVALELVDGKFVPSALGIYVIRYTATDQGGNTAYADRTIKVVDGEIPVITVSGSIAETALIKSSITLPTATATDKGEPLDGVVRSVYLNNEPVALEGDTLKFTVAGEYVISYYAIDEDGNEALVTFTVTVVDDAIAPVLSDATVPERANIGDVIEIPAVTANDEVDGAVAVTVVVKYGTEDVTVTDGKFTIEKNGVYTVIYRATDESGNTAERMHEITVSPVSGDPQDPANNGEGGNGGCGCGSKDAKALAAMVGLLAAALLTVLKFKK